MSVAFRRDSDEEHLEPKFELPIPAGPNLVTARGLALIERRITELESGLRAADETAAAAIGRDLRYWQTRKITAELAPIPVGDKVEFGVRVGIKRNGRRKTFLIVGDDEADPAAGMISFKAPLSQAMLGAEVGEALPFGGDEDALQILLIEVPLEPSDGVA
jgi:transcription elongation GreA/GreB family factor